MSECFNIFMVGVGGQGIGLLAQVLAKAALNAGWAIHACDTHGLAQRGGMVSSHLRLGQAYSPLVPDGQADLVLALERTEAARAAVTMLKDGGSLAWYDAAWQALDVRMGQAKPVEASELKTSLNARKAIGYKVYRADLADPRMQNMVLLSAVLNADLIPRLSLDHVKTALSELLPAKALEANLALLQ
ncbi:MAG TPA: 2-oxoacid:acceptor oxidoreductase family protein [Spirochaetales bacterium]|nr:2-oxoacid:acceptor oxidoreductase family protein [Spirochaetales bacterium]